MARTFGYKDVRNWKVCDHSGKPFTYPKDFHNEGKRNKPMTDLDGYVSANTLAQRFGGVAVRV